MVPRTSYAERSTTVGCRPRLGHECLPHVLLRLRRADEGSRTLLGGTQPFPDSNPVASAATFTGGLPAMVTHLGPLAVRWPLVGRARKRSLTAVRPRLRWDQRGSGGLPRTASAARSRKFHKIACNWRLRHLRSNRRNGRRHQTASPKPGGSGKYVVPRRSYWPLPRSPVTCTSRFMTAQSPSRHLYRFAADFRQSAIRR